MLNTLYLLYGDMDTSFVRFLDDATIFLMVYITPNLGLFVHTYTLIWQIIRLILNWISNRGAYSSLLFIYLGYTTWTYYYHIAKGVEIIQQIQPLWEGTPTGKLWPWIFHFIGFVDEDDQPTFLDTEIVDRFADFLGDEGDDRQIDITEGIDRAIDNLDDFVDDLTDSTEGLDIQI